MLGLYAIGDFLAVLEDGSELGNIRGLPVNGLLIVDYACLNGRNVAGF
jgi:hypothetical protein